MLSKEVIKIPDVELYSTADGEEVVVEFLQSLPPKHQAKAFREIELLKEFGTGLQEPHVKHIDGEIWELRVKFASDISRIFYFVWERDTLVLLHGFLKKTQKTPPREIEIAKNRAEDYRCRHISEQ